jgi:hypothetical protein
MSRRRDADVWWPKKVEHGQVMWCWSAGGAIRWYSVVVVPRPRWWLLASVVVLLVKSEPP